MTVRCVILDFDGTLTDADRHAPLFQARSRQELAALLGWDEPTTARAWASAAAWVAGLPDHAGWSIGGQLVCPAHADPYLIANSIVRSILQRHRPELDETALLDAVFRVHRASYLAVLPGFRADARSVVDKLLDRIAQVWVVTNSHTDTVADLLDGLDLSGRERLRVIGHAGKFSICGCEPPDARFEALSECATFDGIARGVLLRRGKYFDVLRAVWDETDTPPQQTLVAGDIFELDLAMPAALGARVQLVLRAGTLRSERAAVERLPGAGCSASLTSILERLTT
jgi:phosphoglycolate phosphatase-like HAD superfamily hydrolase